MSTIFEALSSSRQLSSVRNPDSCRVLLMNQLAVMRSIFSTRIYWKGVRWCPHLRAPTNAIVGYRWVQAGRRSFFNYLRRICLCWTQLQVSRLTLCSPLSSVNDFQSFITNCGCEWHLTAVETSRTPRNQICRVSQLIIFNLRQKNLPFPACLQALPTRPQDLMCHNCC